ncbi:MAG: glycosyltransferase, partial [Actinobacteria bacterium]|nr:glycosyltransferase [Actinomycetota bacterium]
MSVATGTSVLVPVYREGDTLRQTLPAIRKAAEGIRSVEILLLVQGPQDRSSYLARQASDGDRVRVLEIPRPGKFAALSAGAAAARMPILLLADADSRPPAEAFAALVDPIAAGTADVCAARLVLASAGPPSTRSVVDEWSRVTVDAWHLLRCRRSDLLWALPGPLYAIRRELFPA